MNAVCEGALELYHLFTQMTEWFIDNHRIIVKYIFKMQFYRLAMNVMVHESGAD